MRRWLERLKGLFRTPGKQTLEQQFLPAVLEITDTPPSPLGRITVYVIIGVFTVGLLIACLTDVDIIAVAPGKVISSGKIKMIQPLKSGVVFDIYVKDGQQVKKDDPLIKIKFEDSEGNRIRLEQENLFAQIDVARYSALLEDDPVKSFAPPPDTPPEVLRKNSALLQKDYEKLRTQLKLTEEQYLQTKAEREVVRAEIKKTERVIPGIRERVQAVEKLLEGKFVARVQFLELQQQLFEYEETLQVNKKRLEEADAKLQILSTQKKQVLTTFHSEIMAKLQEAFNKEEILKKELENAIWLDGLAEIRAPEDGIIQELQITTIGGIVTPAQTLMKLVPSNAVLEVEATVLNKDIGFVKEGQAATVKIDSFPYTKYGTIDGTVTTLSRDSIETEKLGLVYNSRIGLSKDTIRVEDKNIRLSAGMTVTVEVKTGKRRILEYLLAPFQEYTSEAMRER